jgi:hypothetical protein
LEIIGYGNNSLLTSLIEDITKLMDPKSP